MPFTVHKWIYDVAIVGLIFTVGGFAARTEMNIADLKSEIDEIKNVRIAEIDKRIVSLETAISIHHGRDWSDKVQKNTLMKVQDLEETIDGISDKFEQRVSKLGTNFNSTAKNMSDIQIHIKAVGLWTKQGDDLIKLSRLEQFRALAVYSTAKVEDSTEIFINKQHVRGRNFNKGDIVMLINPLPPGKQVEVTVKGFIDDPNSSKVLVQINEGLLVDLGLTTLDGQYELFVQSKPESLRWKTLDDIYKDLISE